MKHLLAGLAVGTCLTGCVIIPLDGVGGKTEVLLERKANFHPKEYAPYDGQGDASISGQVVMTLPGGEVAYGAGREVHLDPVTTYSTEWFTKSVIDGQPLETADIRASAYSRTSVADSAGRFRFEGLRPGEYYITCSIAPATPWITTSIGDRTRDATISTYVAYARTQVRPGEATQIVVTR